ncbi:Zinc-uptake regulator, Zur [Pseudooceanicola batsensis HTCC2597]|uniref:Zinc-uptake regulator, Zur n=1 Tax=Pseudooceanicola batsensis (strain ATCC BAA-863 / DSM 15984 / KCTC 12145 / HTCC2597) TaxID=252305 RepID=A3U258_PSEBH|nr:Fur family transcriptional regulator [Pseudooceanicola batsensis]EAQ01658.1 Zinc-uptake regulator, Zur [Pseudooceanicola batsensis HTCC2597]
MSIPDPSGTPREFEPHDHAHCVSDAMASAERICAELGVRLTPVRRRTLEILLEGHRPMGAYDVLERLGEEGYGSKPPVAYRALGFLVENGLAHRIERLNAFVACSRARGQSHAPAFLICRGCGMVAEIAAGLPELPEGFRVEKATVEAEGLCVSCQGAAA